MRKTAAHLPGRFWGLPISTERRADRDLLLADGVDARSRRRSRPRWRSTRWLSAADGDASGLWFLSLLARMAFPESFIWGELAAVGRADTSAADRYFASPGAPRRLDPGQRRRPSSSTAAAA